MKIAILTTDSREHFKDYANPLPYFGTAPEALLQGLAALPELEVHLVSCLQQPVRVPEKLAVNIWYHGLHVPKTGWLRTGYQGCIRAVRRKLKEIQPDIVHGQGTERDCAISAVFSGFPNVLTIHGNMADAARAARARFGSYRWWAARLENVALRRTAGVFCNSRHTRNIVAPRTKRTWRVPNAVRQCFFSTPVPPERKTRCILLHVGEVCENKQQLRVLELAGALYGKNPVFEIWFVGDANQKSGYAGKFLERMRAVESQGFARYLGRTRTAEELVTIFDQASALIHTPIFESFGLVVAEALARNLKLFALSVGGVVDIAAEATGAELLPADDWAGLQTAIARWIAGGHPPPPGAANLMRKRYEPSVIARRHVEIYREVLQ